MHRSVCDYCDNVAVIYISNWFVDEQDGYIDHYWKTCNSCGEILTIDGKRSPWNWGVKGADKDRRDLGDSLKID
jgi:hypothetical protein